MLPLRGGSGVWERVCRKEESACGREDPSLLTAEGFRACSGAVLMRGGGGVSREGVQCEVRVVKFGGCP